MGDALSHTKSDEWWYTNLSEFYKLENDETIEKTYKSSVEIIEQEVGTPDLESKEDHIINTLFKMSFGELETILFYNKISNEFPIVPYSELKYKTSIVYRFRKRRVDFYSNEMYSNFQFIERHSKNRRKGFKSYINLERTNRLKWFLETNRISDSLFGRFENDDLTKEYIIKKVMKELASRND